MLSVALANCGGADVRLVQQDIRALCLPRPVDLVTANFDTLNHLVRDVDLAMGLRQIFRNLRPGGHLIFDLVTPCQPVGVGRIYSRRLRSATCTALQQVRWDEPRRMLSIVVVLRSPAWRQPVVELHRERAYSPAEIGRHLLDVGFMIRGVHDAATLAPARHCPSRIIVVATRPDGRPLCRAG
jgi:SAM-dependent methyltransferase